jgi:hypothetical protein
MQTFNFLHYYAISKLLGYHSPFKTPQCIRYPHKIASLYLIFAYKNSYDFACIISSCHRLKSSENFSIISFQDFIVFVIYVQSFDFALNLYIIIGHYIYRNQAATNLIAYSLSTLGVHHVSSCCYPSIYPSFVTLKGKKLS